MSTLTSYSLTSCLQLKAEDMPKEENETAANVVMVRIAFEVVVKQRAHLGTANRFTNF